MTDAVGRFEVRETAESAQGDIPYRLYADGQAVSGVHVGRHSNIGGRPWTTLTFVSGALTVFGAAQAKSFFDLCQSLECETPYASLHPWLKRVSVSRAVDGEIISSVSIEPDLANWTGPYSFAEFLQEIEALLPAQLERYGDIAMASTQWQIGDATVAGLFETVAKEHAAAMDQAKLNLEQRFYPATVIRQFAFPKEHRAACEQYLMYFGQFLQDLGLAGTIAVQEEASHTLFRVVPSGSDDALLRVSEALDLYLGLPADPVALAVVDENADVAALQLKAQVFHLRSQMELAKALVQSKDVTIAVLQDALVGYQRVAGERSNTRTGQEDVEPVIKGVLSVKDIEPVEGVTLHAPEMLRRLKRFWRK